MTAPLPRTVIPEYGSGGGSPQSVLSSPQSLNSLANNNLIGTAKRPASDDSTEVVTFFTEKTMSVGRAALAKIAYVLSYTVSFFVQGIFHPIFFVTYHTFFRLKINGREKLKDVKGPVIFVSNHIGFYDSFIFDLFVPAFSQNITPFRFMGTTQFQIWYLQILKYTGIIHLIYLLFGVFKVTYGQGAEKALRPAYNIIKNGGTVAIFPEGKIWRHWTKENPIGPFKWGAAILAKNTGALVIPVAFNKEHKRLFRDRITVNIGDGYYVDRYDTPEDLADDMREKVMALHN